MEYNSVIRIIDMKFADKSMENDNIIVSEIIQTQRGLYGMDSLISRFENLQLVWVET